MVSPPPISCMAEGSQIRLLLKEKVERLKGFLSCRPNWTPTPLPPLGPRGETHSLVGEGVGDPILTKERNSSTRLKGPKLEMFVAEYFTQSKPVSELGNKFNFLCLGPYILLFTLAKWPVSSLNHQNFVFFLA